MLAKTESAYLFGMDASEVQVETDIANGLPAFNIVGLPDTAIKEAKERVRASISNSEFEFPLKRITVNLAPADVKKEGPLFDLPIATAVLAACKHVPRDKLLDYLVVGELSLNGDVRRVNGALLMALCAKKKGKKGIILPHLNAEEAALVKNLEVVGVRTLREAVSFLKGDILIEPAAVSVQRLFSDNHHFEVDFSDVKGQEHARRALEVAAAGSHNLLMIGPPGSGKTMLAKRLPTILPPIVFDEAVEITKLYSVAGLLPQGTALVTSRPFRAPHHTISTAGLAGGGTYPRPGELSLAHHGVLFLDEFAEFQKNSLQVLRQPLEDEQVTIARAAITLTYPARFTLVGAMNPCSCGYFGDKVRECKCSPHQIERYRAKISGPLLDRIDIHLEVPRLTKEELLRVPSGEDSSKIRKRVKEARARQTKRFAKYRRTRRKTYYNSQMTPLQVREFCHLSDEAANFLSEAIDKLGLSARAYDRVLKVARTIADLAAKDIIGLEHLAEAIQYRSLDRPAY